MAVFQSNAIVDAFLETIVSQSSSATIDIPITEIDIEIPTMVQKKPALPTEPRILSLLGPREEMAVEPALPIGPDIHDAHREKIVIRPRCKEYVQKQKQRSIRTLACFTPALAKSNEKSPSLEPEVAVKDVVVLPAKIKLKTTPTRPGKAPPAAPRAMAKAAPVMPRMAPPMMPRALTKPRATVSSGRIEKPPKSPPRKFQMPDLPMDAFSVVAVRYELYSCGCSTPSQCQQCTLRRLADKFCAIVSARKEKIRQNQIQSRTSAMYS
ncbi:hypothetical protein B0H19DRAFT_1095218 [Mycena capillaripes]|nr:hypothetical protein B0H19DRAFT_1095218 [Mycena capillaripes]